MNLDDWRYEWIKTAIQNGVPVETATKAFDEYRHEQEVIDCTADPAISAQDYVSTRLTIEPEFSL